jgi:hypothetical protein
MSINKELKVKFTCDLCAMWTESVSLPSVPPIYPTGWSILDDGDHRMDVCEACTCAIHNMGEEMRRAEAQALAESAAKVAKGGISTEAENHAKKMLATEHKL